MDNNTKLVGRLLATFGTIFVCVVSILFGWVLFDDNVATTIGQKILVVITLIVISFICIGIFWEGRFDND